MNYKAKVSKKGNSIDYINMQLFNGSEENGKPIGIVTGTVEVEDGYELTVSINKEYSQQFKPRTMSMEVLNYENGK